MEPFGIGNLFLQPNKTGNYIELMVLQDINWDFKFDLKELHGAYQFPVSVKRGKGSIDGSARYARIRSDAYAIAMGLAISDVTDGQRLVAQPPKVQIPAAAGPYTHTPAVPLNGIFVGDIAVYRADDGDSEQMTQVTGAPAAAGEYSVNTGTGEYTFHADDAELYVRIIYLYSASATELPGARSMTLTNQLLGTTPVTRGIFAGNDGERQIVLELDSIVPGGIKMGLKIDDWQMNDIPLKAFANCANEIGRINITDTEEC